MALGLGLSKPHVKPTTPIPPPDTNFRITETGARRITQAADNRIVEPTP